MLIGLPTGGMLKLTSACLLASSSTVCTAGDALTVAGAFYELCLVIE